MTERMGINILLHIKMKIARIHYVVLVYVQYGYGRRRRRCCSCCCYIAMETVLLCIL